MPFQVSPGVNVSEIDLTTSVPAVATSIGGVAGRFSWGPVGKVVTIGSETDLIKYFGKPTSANYKSWFTAANFLAYSNSLKIARVVAQDAKNAVSGTPTVTTPTDAQETYAGVGETVDNFVGSAGGDISPAAAADGTTTVFTLNGDPTNRTLTVTVGSTTLTSGVGYTISGQDITFTTAPEAGQTISVVSDDLTTFILSRETFNATVTVTVGGTATTDFTVTGTTLEFTNAPADGSAIVATIAARTEFGVVETIDATDTVGVTVDGVAQVAGTDYTLSGQVVTFNTAPTNAAVVVLTVFGASATTFAYSPALVKNEDEVVYGSGQASGSAFAARCPGAEGDGLKVYMVDSAVWAGASAAVKSLFDSAPGTNELHVVVVRRDADGTEKTLETFAYLSKASNGKSEDGKNIFFANVINASSDYVFVLNNPADGTDWGSELTLTKTTFADLTAVYANQLGGGADGATPTSADAILAYDLFADPEIVDVALMMTGEWAELSDGEAVLTHVIDNIASTRKDCVAVVSPRYTDVISGNSANVISYFTTTVSTRSNYAFVDSNYKYQYDKYNDVYRWVPFNGDVAGLMARTDAERDAWFSPAGFNRGVIKNVIKVAWQQTKAHRDELYKNALNPIVTFSGQGTVLYGDKTFVSKPSAFDRINVRRLFIVLEKAIANASKYTMFEFNDEFTRSQFVALVEPFLRDVKGRRGIYDFAVVCDESNNTPGVIDRNEFVGDIYIKPARSINYIQLNFVAVRSGVAFEEVIGQV